MSPYAWTAPKVQMSARLPPHRAAMGGRLSIFLSAEQRTILVFVPRILPCLEGGPECVFAAKFLRPGQKLFRKND
jgi:hypothetical protein